jgi:hypothetical protein
VQKTLFCDLTTVEILIKNVLSKENQKSPFIRFGRSKSPVKGLKNEENEVQLLISIAEERSLHFIVSIILSKKILNA